ncbi:MAG TPA: peptidase S9, partial [Rubricoccaceae bacterium]
PPWFNEGLAEYSALGWDTATDSYVRDALLDGALPPVDRLGGYDAYRGGQAFWDFVAAEYGREKVTEILDRVRLGRSVPAAVRRATGLSLADLSDRWQAALRPVHFPEATARDALADVARPLVTARRTGTRYHGRPALTALGDRVATVATRDGLFDVLVAETTGDVPPRTLVRGQQSGAFEGFRLSSAGLAWSPDGRTLAVAVTSGPSDAVALVDARTGASRLVRPLGLDAVLALAWRPDGRALAVEATAGAQSDLFLLDPETGAATNLTRDLWADHAPAWAPDGRALVFHSDRGDALDLGRDDTAAALDGDLDVRTLGRTSADLYRLDLDRPDRLTRLTDDPVWDETDAQLATGPDGTERLVFLSDRNGVANLYERAPDGAERPLTNLQTGLLGLSLSSDGERAAVLALDRGVPAVFLLRAPLGAAGLPDTLAPTVWALRRTGGDPADAPAVQIASDRLREANPFLRDALDGRPPMLAVARRRFSPEDAARVDSLVAALLARADSVRAARGDTASVGPDSLAFAPPDARPERPPAGPGPFRPAVARDAEGRLVARRYRLRFTPDLVTAAGSYDTVYGVQSVTQMRFSDVLGDWRIALATNLVLDLRNADYVLSLRALRGRREVSLEGFHLARELPDFDGATVFRYRNYGVVGALR